jgi:hypothetical protein
MDSQHVQPERSKTSRSSQPRDAEAEEPLAHAGGGGGSDYFRGVVFAYADARDVHE